MQTKPKTQGRPKDPEKRAAILEVAGRLFLERGYEGTTVDAVAAEAEVSKLTVYSHFDDKAGLFKTLVTSKCASYLERSCFSQLQSMPVEQALAGIGKSFMGLMLNPEVLAMQRLMAGNAGRNAELAAMYYETGPGPTFQSVAEVLAAFDRSGQLRIEDSRRAADHFLSMLRGDIWLRALLNCEPGPSEREIDEHVEDCVAAFTRAYAAA